MEKNVVVTELDKVARETSLGEFIVKYRTAVIAFVLLLVVGVIGFGFYSKYKSGVSEAMDKIIYAYTTSALQDFKDGKIDADKLIVEFNLLQDKIGNYDGGVASVIDTSDTLVSKNKLEQALVVAKSGHSKYSRSSAYVNYFIATRLVAIYEDLDKTNDAIALLEGLQTSSVKLLESKNYLDLGRLYYKAGNLDKAKTNLDYLVNNFSQDEFAKIGKLFLDEISKKMAK